jgi:outer membrane protein OmpA-like peptidoglycan-associated protein
VITGPRARSWRVAGAAGRLALAALIAPALTGAAVGAAHGQSAPSFGGVEVRAGLATPGQAELAPSIFADLDLGYVRAPQLRLLVGVNRFVANIDREPGGDEGSYTATGVWAGARYDLMPWRTLAPYIRAGLTLQNVDADAFDRDVGALLDGTYVGLAGGIGAAYRLDDAGRLAATAELRRTFLNNIGNTALEVGVRFQRLGWTAYVRDPARIVGLPTARPTRGAPASAGMGPAVAPAAPTAVDAAAERTLAELERAVLEAERALQALREAPLPPPVERGEPAPARATRPAPPPVGDEAMLRQGLARAVAGMRSLGGVRETERDFLLALEGRVFASGSRTLAPAARDDMRVLATVLAGYPGYIITVEGHTDSVGDPSANQSLSEARATAVRAALIAEGVDPLWVGARGFGAERPIASNQTAAGRAANRRVDIRVSRTPCPSPPRRAADGTLTC